MPEFLGKKGQFYLITSFILIAVAFTLVNSSRGFKPAASSFSFLNHNLEKESALAINQALVDSSPVDSSYRAFFISFMGYSRTIDSQYSAAYVLNENGESTVYNGLQAPLHVGENGLTLQPNQNMTIPFSPKLTLDVDGTGYAAEFARDSVQLRILSMSVDQENKKVSMIEIG